jgi:hypothetical protein
LERYERDERHLYKTLLLNLYGLKPIWEVKNSYSWCPM